MRSDISLIRCGMVSVEEDFEILADIFQLCKIIIMLCDNLLHSYKVGVTEQTSEHCYKSDSR